MKTRLKKDALLEVLDKAVKFADPNNALPIAANFLIVGDGEHVYVYATDLKCFFKGAIKNATTDSFSFCVPAIIFHQTIKDFRENNIDISIPDYRSIQIGKGKSKYKISCFSSDEFPEYKGHEKMDNEIHLKGNTYKTLVTNCCHFISGKDDAAKLQFSGVHVTSENGYFVATGTDSNFLCQGKSDILSMISFSGILLDDDTIKKSCLISGVEESIEIYHNSKSVVFRTEIRDCEFEFSSTLLEYKFPYDVCKKIIAVEPPNEVVINSVEIRETVKRVVRYTSKELSIAEVRLSKTPSVYAEDLNFGNNAEEELTSIDIPETVKDINIAFNGFKLSTILHQIEEESIFFSFTAENKAVFITPIYPAKREVEYKYMIMPSVTLNK